MWEHWVVVFSVVGTEKCISSHVAVVGCTGMQQIAMEKYGITFKEQKENSHIYQQSPYVRRLK